MHYDVLDVGMRYSLPVMFHVFPVVKRGANRAVMSKDHRQCTHTYVVGACGKEWDSPTEVGGRRKSNYDLQLQPPASQYAVCVEWLYILYVMGQTYRIP